MGGASLSSTQQERIGYAVKLDTPSVEAGGTVRGELVLEQDARLGEVKSFTLSCVRVLEGGKRPRLRRVGPPVIHRGRIIPPARVPFAFTVPAEGPITWAGQQVKLGWQLHLKLETTVQTVEGTEPFQVVPRKISQLAPSEPMPSTRRTTTSGVVLSILSILMCWLPCFGAPFFFLSKALSEDSSPGEKTLGWVLGLLAVVAAILGSNFWVARWRSGRSGVSAELLPQRQSFALGSTATVRLSLQLDKQVRVMGATARLWTKEQGQAERQVHEWSRPVDLPAMLEGEYQLDIELLVPEHLPPTLHFFDVRTESYAEVVLKIRDVDDLLVQRELIIAPELLVPETGAPEAAEATETAPPR
jgi:hypothetical protein